MGMIREIFFYSNDYFDKNKLSKKRNSASKATIDAAIFANKKGTYIRYISKDIFGGIPDSTFMSKLDRSKHHFRISKPKLFPIALDAAEPTVNLIPSSRDDEPTSSEEMIRVYALGRFIKLKSSIYVVYEKNNNEIWIAETEKTDQ